jgi:hypothetical protein
MHNRRPNPEVKEALTSGYKLPFLRNGRHPSGMGFSESQAGGLPACSQGFLPLESSRAKSIPEGCQPDTTVNVNKNVVHPPVYQNYSLLAHCVKLWSKLIDF